MPFVVIYYKPYNNLFQYPIATFFETRNEANRDAALKAFPEIGEPILLNFESSILNILNHLETSPDQVAKPLFLFANVKIR